MTEGFLDSEYVRNEFTRGAYSQQEMAQEFDRWLDQVKADAWDEGYRDGHNDGLSDGHPLGNDREPEENPYREQGEAR